MEENSSPVLCFGTFFTLLLREGVKELSTKRFESVESNKNKLTEVTAFLELNRIITPSFTPANENTFSVQASKFKSCAAQKAKMLPIVNASEVKSFLACFESDYDSIFNNMSTFVNTYIHVDVSRRKRLVKSLLELIRDDKDIGPEEKFYINGRNNALSKRELLSKQTFSCVKFLIGIFRYIVEVKRNDNIKGEPTYRKWCPPANQGLRMYSEDIYVGETIREKINLIEDDTWSLPKPIRETNTDIDISYLTGIDKADYLKSEAEMFRRNQDYEKSLQLYYESWRIYHDVIGSKSRCTIKILKIMEELYIQLDKSYSFAYWLNNIAKRGEDIV